MKTILATLSLSVAFGMITLSTLSAQVFKSEPVEVPADAKIVIDLTYANVETISVGSRGTITVTFTESERSFIKFGRLEAILPKSDRQNLIYQMLLHAHFSGSTVEVGTRNERKGLIMIVDARVQLDQE